MILIRTAQAAEADQSWGCFGTGDAVGYLLLVLMLLMFLFIRVSRRSDAASRPPPPRPRPGSIDQLGSALFRIIKNDDAAAYRSLFLVGDEVRMALGRGADTYLEGRTLGMYQRSLDGIAKRVPPGASFDGAFILRDALARV